MSASRLPEPGERIAEKYRLTSVLGRGGMGVVFEAHHELLDRRVAIKVLAPEVMASEEAVRRFMNEARAAGRITSDRVVQVLDVGILDTGLPFMVMERLEGVDLGQLLEQNGALPVVEAVDLLLEAIEGVAHAHLEGIIHRDLKPANLFVARRPDRTTVVKVLDFGISKLTGGGVEGGLVTATNAVIGSPMYMSPEQLRSSKSIDVRADVWSLGVIAYELLSNALPFSGNSIINLFEAIRERRPEPLEKLRPEVPTDLARVVTRCLAPEPDHRFANVFALATALAPFGSARGRAALERIEAHVSSKGLSFETLSSRPEARAPLAAAPAPREPSSLETDVTEASALPGPVPIPAASSSLPLVPAAGSTSAPWSSTRNHERAKRTSASAAAFGVALAIAAVGAVWSLTSSTRSPREADALTSTGTATVTALPPPPPLPSTRASAEAAPASASASASASAPESAKEPRAVPAPVATGKRSGRPAGPTASPSAAAPTPSSPLRMTTY